MIGAVLGPGSRVRRTVRWAAHRLGARAAILMYHQISEDRPDPWNLCVSPAHFREHLEVLRKSGARLLSVADLARALARGEVPRRAIAISFDDGYRDNLDAARPLLEAYDAPATVFISSGYVGSRGEFWWDTLERVFLEPRELPDRLVLQLGEVTRTWEFGSSLAQAAADRAAGPWSASMPPRTPREQVYQELRTLLLFATAAERRRCTTELLDWAGLPGEARTAKRILDAEGVRQLAHGGLVEIGAHTVSHPDLRGLDLASQRHELGQGKADLEALTGLPVQGMAYPHGGATEATRRLAGEAGFAYACGTVGGGVAGSSDRLRLPRNGIRDIPGAEFRARIAELVAL